MHSTMGTALPADRPRSGRISSACVKSCSFLTGLLFGDQTSQHKVVPNGGQVNQSRSRVTDQSIRKAITSNETVVKHNFESD